MDRVIKVLQALREIADKAESVARYRALVAEAARRGDLDLVAYDLSKTAQEIDAFIGDDNA